MIKVIVFEWVPARIKGLSGPDSASNMLRILEQNNMKLFSWAFAPISAEDLLRGPPQGDVWAIHESVIPLISEIKKEIV